MNTEGNRKTGGKAVILAVVLLSAAAIFLLARFSGADLLDANVVRASVISGIEVNGTVYDPNQYAGGASKAPAEGNSLDKDAFLRLLVTQMQYQDPLDPQDNSEFIAQLAQFSTLEQMTNVSSGMSKLATMVENIDSSLLVGQLSNMIGQEIRWETVTEGQDADGAPLKTREQHTGIVKGIKLSDGVPVVVANDGIEDHTVALDAIKSVGYL